MAELSKFTEWLRKTKSSYIQHQSDDSYDTYNGITYKQFKKHCKNVTSKEPSRNLFIKINSDEYNGLIREILWDKIYGDEIRSQKIANIIAFFAHSRGLDNTIRSVKKVLAKSEDVFLEDSREMDSKTIGVLNTSTKAYKLLTTELSHQLAKHAKQHTTFKLLSNWTRELDLLLEYNKKMRS